MQCRRCNEVRTKCSWRPSQWAKWSDVTEDFQGCKHCNGAPLPWWLCEEPPRQPPPPPGPPPPRVAGARQPPPPPGPPPQSVAGAPLPSALLPVGTMAQLYHPSKLVPLVDSIMVMPHRLRKSLSHCGAVYSKPGESPLPKHIEGANGALFPDVFLNVSYEEMSQQFRRVCSLRCLFTLPFQITWNAMDSMYCNK